MARVKVRRKEGQTQAEAKEQAAQERMAERQRLVHEHGNGEEFDDGQLLVFDKKFRNEDYVYSYAAMRVRGKWYLTGQEGNPKTWTELLAFAEDRNTIEVGFYYPTDLVLYEPES